MWNQNLYQHPGARPWQQNLINGNRGPFGAPKPNETYEMTPQYMPGARGYNAGYTQSQQTTSSGDWFNQSQQGSVQYTSVQKPSYWDAFGYGAQQVQYYGDGKNQLNLQDVQQAFKTNQSQAQKLLNALDADSNSGLSEVEMAAFTLLSDSPGTILWNVVQANKTNPNYPNRPALTELENELKRALMFDNQGNPVNRPADGRIDPADRELLNKAVNIAPDLIKATLQELRRTLNLDSSYAGYTQAKQRFEGTFRSPLANTLPAGGYNPYNPSLPNGVNIPANPWQTLNWLCQPGYGQTGQPGQPQGNTQMQLYMLLLMLSASSTTTALPPANGLAYNQGYGQNYGIPQPPWGQFIPPAFQASPMTWPATPTDSQWYNQPLSING